MPAPLLSRFNASLLRCSVNHSLGIQNCPNLMNQLVARVRFGNEATQPSVEHVAELNLFRNPAAQDNANIRVQSLQFIKDGVAVHHRQEIVENYERDPRA